MAATLLSGALSFHVGAQATHQPNDGDCRAIAGGRRGPLGMASSSCLPFYTQQTRALLLQRGGERTGARSVRVGSLKDSQREVVRHVDEQSKPVELGSPPGLNGNDRSQGEDSHSSESPEEAAAFLEARAEEEGVSLKEEVEEEGVSGTVKGTLVATVVLLAFVGGFGALGVVYKDQINDILTQFSDFLEGYGPAGYALFVLGYAGLEVLAIPAVPLTMSAGLLFGTLYGTILVSIAGTLAATASFLIARYFARDRILKLAERNPKFLAIDKAIGADGFRVVTLLRLSPLLPFSLGNYLYGLTSVELGPYVLGSWLGMLPGTWAYVSAGAIGRAFIKQEEDAAFPGGPASYWTLGLGLVATVFAASYIGKLAKDAMKDIEDA
ncbi:hypothetical protein KC19_6G064400 [Ceratodon purpureus]|uniref:VTT domain-containing protein n=1 Tax=Ceratodon purpureus TaxID=3225 RepID=A0A8T0HC83_CERPU|nr:hypothetical protein KC19_6G064400 [Ceratodon purpureus]